MLKKYNSKKKEFYTIDHTISVYLKMLFVFVHEYLFPFNTINQYLFPIFRLAFSPILYKFIIRAFWAWAHSCFGFESKLVLTPNIWKPIINPPQAWTCELIDTLKPLLQREVPLRKSWAVVISWNFATIIIKTLHIPALTLFSLGYFVLSFVLDFIYIYIYICMYIFVCVPQRHKP